jgi:hypothetical protein
MVDEELRSARLGGSRRLSCGVDFLTLHFFQVESFNAKSTAFIANYEHHLHSELFYLLYIHSFQTNTAHKAHNYSERCMHIVM